MAISQQPNWWITVCLVLSSAVAIVANFLLVLIFFVRRGLRTISNRFVVNLLITNLLSSILIIPLFILDQNFDFIKEISISVKTFFCHFAQFAATLTCTASILSVLLIGVDQYFAVIYSLRYHSFIDKTKSLIFILTSWGIALTFAVLGYFTQSDDKNIWEFCRAKSKIAPNSILNAVYSLSYFTAVILVPLLAICTIYVFIYKAAHKSSARMRKSNVDLIPEGKTLSKILPKVQSAPTFSSIDNSYLKIQNDFLKIELPKNQNFNGTRLTNTTSHFNNYKSNLFHSLRYRISNASMFRYREESRAAKISILVIFMVLAGYVPYGLALVLNSHILPWGSPILFNKASIILLGASNLVSPFFFAFRNKRVQRELWRLLGFSRQKNAISHVCNNKNRRRRNLRCLEQAKAFDEENALDEEKALAEDEIRTLNGDKAFDEVDALEEDDFLDEAKKNCNCIILPDSCLNSDARSSFSSASTQISTED